MYKHKKLASLGASLKNTGAKQSASSRKFSDPKKSTRKASKNESSILIEEHHVSGAINQEEALLFNAEDDFESEFEESKGGDLAKNVFKDLISQVNMLNKVLIDSPSKQAVKTSPNKVNKENGSIATPTKPVLRHNNALGEIQVNLM